MKARLGPLGASGDEATQRRLVRYLKSGRVHPALLWVGPDPQVKLAAAKGMAKALLCRALPEKEAYCGECSPCRRVEKELHPDLILLTDADSTTIKIETVREICHEMQLSAVESGAKVCIIDECHRMTPAAANAFLKSLEEPGERRHFILLTTQPGTLLPTVLSRCIQFHFLPTCEELSGGDPKQYEEALSQFLLTRDTAALRPFADEKSDALGFVHFLQHRLRDAVVSAAKGSPSADALGGMGLYGCLEAFHEATRLEGRLRSNVNYALMLEHFLIERFAGIS